MIDNQRRNLVIGALLAPLAASITIRASAAEKSMHDHNMPDMGPDMANMPWMGEEQIAMLVYPCMTVMDLVGPHCMFGSLMGARFTLSLNLWIQ
ncbi:MULTISPECIES: hypothetical protein [unclassified Pseudomonas]|uniref:hypothetical protein n=1 Tax=unclassified Pseudomonas TaxID=196821 RepID=UPI001EEF85B0|nr:MULTISPECIES: hypothetical protein [unclassified Pseudomonas]